MCPRPTPDWQKGIGDFFGGPGRVPEKENQLPLVEEGEAGGSGTSKASRRSESAHHCRWEHKGSNHMPAHLLRSVSVHRHREETQAGLNRV